MEPDKNTHNTDETHVEPASDTAVASEEPDVAAAHEAPAEDEAAPADAETDAAPAPVAPEDVHEVEPEAETVPSEPAPITSPIFVSKTTTLPEILTTLGFASIFVVFAAVAFFQPKVLEDAYLQNVLGRAIGHAALAVEISMFVNVFLGVLLLIGRRKPFVYALAGTWLIIIAVFKVLILLG